MAIKGILPNTKIIYWLAKSTAFGSSLRNMETSGLLKNKKTIESLEKQISYYKNEIAKNKEKLDELQSNTNDLEKFARENYYMKKENEELFIIDQN